jgi:sulfate adenylyltransferase
MGAFKEPHGGELKNLYLDEAAAEAEKQAAGDCASWDLTERQLCDIELILNGAFSPLEGFLNQDDYDAVVSGMRLTSGVLWPMPITLDVTDEFAADLKTGDKVALRDLEGVILATLEVGDIWTPDKAAEAKGVFGTTDEKHPAVHFLNHIAGPVYVGGKLTGIEAPTHYDFKHLRESPAEVRARFKKLGWRKVVAFQTRNPMHRAHQEISQLAAREVEANLLIHPVVGMTKPGDVDHYTRVRCYEHILKHYPEQTTSLSLLPLAMRMLAVAAAARHAHGRAARSAVARHHPQELRLHAHHHRPRPRGSGQGLQR